MNNKNSIKSMRWLGAVCALGITSFLAPQVDAAMLYISANTFLKANTGQSSALADNQKCAFTAGQAMEISSIVDGGASHWKVTTPRNYAGCGITTGFIYQPHTSTAGLSVTVHTTTFLKKTTASASTLPAASKCTLNPGVYSLSAAPTTTASHFALNTKTLAPGCAFSTGFLFTGHTNAGITVLSLGDSTFLKTSTANSSALPAADKCLIAKANYVMKTVPTTSGGHYNVSLSAAPAGCALTTGYVYFELTLLNTPAGFVVAPPPTAYDTPMPNGVAYSGDFSWCVCRNIGTSPHIGQDWNAPGAESSRAVANGTVVDKTFVNGCGHYLLVEDTSGARWRYLHLNSNNWQIGDTMTKGQFIANHGDFPIVGQCGSGPHLHLERRSAGGFNDSETFKTCQTGTKSCNFNPNKPFAGAGTTAPARAPVELVTEVSASAFIVPVQAATAGICRNDPADYAAVSDATLKAYQLKGAGLSVSRSTAKAAGYKQLSLSAGLDDNEANNCGGGKNCLVSWQVVAETASGLKRVFFDASLRNRKAQVINAEQLCLPSDATGKLHVLVRDFQGAQYRTAVTVE